MRTRCIKSIDTTAARSAPGVLAVLTAADAAADGLKPLRPYAEANVQTGEPFAFAAQPLLASDKVRFAGEPVALIVAETHAQALDAAELVVVDYETLPAVTSPEAARAQGAPQLASEIPRQHLPRLAYGRHGGRRSSLRCGRACRVAPPSTTIAS